MHLKNNSTELKLSDKTGAVESLVLNGKNLLNKAGCLFTIGLRDERGDLEILNSNEFASLTHTQNGTSISLCYKGHPCHPSLEVNIAIRADGVFFHFKPEIRNIPAKKLLEWVDVPQISVTSDGTIFWPNAEGVLVTNPKLREASPWSRYHILGFLGLNEAGAFSEGGYYPGVCQMQFISWQKDGMTVYFGAHDSAHGTKGVEFAPDGEGRLRLSLQTFCGGVAGKDYTSSFEYVLGAMNGDWMDACEVYRSWIENDSSLPRKGTLPEIVKESPVVMIYPVRGNGGDSGSMKEGNEYFPYVNAMPAVKKYAEVFGSKILSLLMHWEGTAPWAPPYVWPPFGGAEMLAEYAKQLHRDGHYLGVYCSGTAWTQKSCIVDYSREKECEEKRLRKHMIRGPKGEINAVICCGEKSQRFGFDMCLTEEWSRKTVTDELEKLIDAKIDYTQFFDQNLGGCFHTCYSREHNHPPVPGPWQTQTMKSLLFEMTELIRRKGSKMVLGSEAAAADAYLRELPFNDLRSCFVMGVGTPVPGYQFVFHEYSNNFMGNQCGTAAFFDCMASPENLFYRTAYAFNSGDLLSLVLKEAGKIHWGWGAPWDMEDPNQEQEITLIRNLNDARRQYSEFFQYGKMLKPLAGIKCGKLTLKTTGEPRDVDSVLHSSWESPDGRRMQFVVNYLPKAQRVKVVRNGTESEIELEALSVKALK